MRTNEHDQEGNTSNQPRIQNTAALPLIWTEYKSCRSNILWRVRGHELKEKVQPRDNFHENRGTTCKLQLKWGFLPVFLNPSHMSRHVVRLQHPLHSCISITGDPILFFPILSMEVPNKCIFTKCYEFLGDSVTLQNLSPKYFPMSVPLVTARLKLPHGPPLQFAHSVHPVLSRTDTSFPSHHRYAETVLKSSPV